MPEMIPMLFGVRTYLKLAAGLGIEPKFSLSESDVRPLDDPAKFKNTSTNYNKIGFWTTDKINKIEKGEKKSPGLVRERSRGLRERFASEG